MRQTSVAIFSNSFYGYGVLQFFLKSIAKKILNMSINLNSVLNIVHWTKFAQSTVSPEY